MLSSIFILIFIVALILLIISVYEESVVFSMLSFITWMIVFAQSLYIVQPYVVWTDIGGSANITEGVFQYNEFGLSALSMAFVFFSVIWTIVCFMRFKRESQLP